MNAIGKAALYAIQARDPDGDEYRTTAPSEADYDRHRRWAIEAYGPDVWAQYKQGGWDEPDWY
ncbi:MAG: hypothetical protein ABWZ30_01075 [Jiangellaceae bacterium]